MLGPTRTQATILIALASLLLVGLAGWTRIPHPPQRWVYKIEAPGDDEFAPVMDSLGRQGWELVSARRATSSSSSSQSASYEMIFKRPLP